MTPSKEAPMGFVTRRDENGLGRAVPDGFGGTRLVYLTRKHGADLNQPANKLRESDDIAVEGLDGRVESASRASPIHGVGGCELCRILGAA
jgi:hypothetical protein